MSPPRKVTMPVKIRVNAGSINAGTKSVLDAVDSASTRALTNASVVVADSGGGGPLRIYQPHVVWYGDGLDDVDFERQRMIDQRLVDQLKNAAAALLPPPKTKAKAKAKAKAEPKLLKPPQPQTSDEPPLPVLHDPPPSQELEYAESLPPFPKPPALYEVSLFENLLQSPNGLTRSRAFLALLPYLEYGDDTAFELIVLYGVRADDKQPTSAALGTLRQYARRRPARFKQLLRTLLLVMSPGHKIEVERREEGIWVGEIVPMHRMAQVVRVAEAIPQAAALLRELERGAGGTTRLLGLLEAVLAARRDLIDYLLKAPRSSVMGNVLRYAQNGVAAYEGVFAQLSLFGASTTLDVYELEADLLANVDWVGVTLARAREIDSIIGQYRRFLGDAAYDTDEVKILQGVRNGYLNAVASNPFPTREKIKKVVEAGDTDLGSWREQAVAAKVPRLLKGIDELKKHSEMIGSTPKHYSSWSYEKALSDTMHSVYETKDAIGNVLVDWPGIDLLQTAARAEHDLAVNGVKVALLILWWQALHLREAMDYREGGDQEKHAGGDAERRAWSATLERTISEVSANYEKPNYKALAENVRRWQKDIEWVATAIQDWQKSQLKKKLLIGVVAIIITGGVAVALEGAPLVLIVIAEAGTFTLVETGLEVGVLGEDVKGEDVAKMFAEQVVFFGAGRILSKLGAFTIEALGAERALLKLSVLLGEAALQASVPPVLERLETGEWPESTRTMFGAGFLLNVVAAGITKRGVIRDARLQTALRTELETLARERQEWLAQMEEIAARGGPTREDFQRAKWKGIALYEELENALNKMRGLSDDGLRAMRLTREGVNEMADMSRSFRDQIEAQQYVAIRGLKKLPPAPESVASGLVRRSPVAFEYNPNAPGRSIRELVKRFRNAGYEVTEKGGVLFLEGPSGTPPYRLLPAAPDVAPTLRITGRVAKAGAKLFAQDPALMEQLTRVAQTKGEEVANRLARSVGRMAKGGIIGPQSAAELRGVLRFLSRGGDPETLARLLNPRDLADADMRNLMRFLNHLDEDAVKGVKVLFDIGLNPARVNDAIQNMGREAPEILNGTLGALSDIAPRSRHLRKIAHFLYGNNVRNYRAAQGVLFAAVEELRLNPDAIIVFEEPVVDVLSGRIVRFTDIHVTFPGGRHPLRVEVKEIAAAASLGEQKVLRELANDIAEDFRLRTTPPVRPYRPGSLIDPFEPPRPTTIPASATEPFQTVKWRIRYNDMAQRVAKRMKIDDIYDVRVFEAVKTNVRAQLRGALDDPALAGILHDIPADEVARYRQAFEKFDFVTLF